MRRTITLGVGCLMAIGLAACHNCSHDEQNPPVFDSSSRPQGSGTTAGQASNPPEVHQATTLVGVLQSHPDAAGQTTWMLIGDNSAGGMRVDISHVRDVATGLDGKHVRIVGHMVAAPAGGISTILADSIIAAPVAK